MTQLALPGVSLPARARATDPATSYAAAASITTEDLRDSQAAVLQVLADAGPCHDGDLVATYQARAEAGEVRRQSTSGIRSRRAELAVMGRVVPTGEAVLPTGRRAQVWGVAA